ncbi:MAG: hypothetical protein AAB953_01395, partial [Patescibacteria group bacterium]
VIEMIAPYASRKWRVVAYGLAGALGVTMSSLDIIKDESQLSVFAVWLGVSIGFTMMFGVLIEAFHVIFEGQRNKVGYASTAAISVVVSMITAVFHQMIGEDSWGLAPRYVVNALLYMLGFGFVGLGAMISWFLASLLRSMIKLMIGWLEEFVKTLRTKSKHTSMSEKGAKFVLVFCSIFAGILVSYGFSKAHGGGIGMGALVGTGSGIGITMILILIEGMAIWVVFNREFGIIRKLIALVVAACIVTIPAFVTFGSVYYTNSEKARFEETKLQVINSMDAYLMSVAGNCKQLETSLAGDPSAKMYSEPIEKLRAAKDLANTKNDRP